MAPDESAPGKEIWIREARMCEERSSPVPKDNTDIRLQDDIIRTSSSPSAVSVSSLQSKLPFPVSSFLPCMALLTVSCSGTADCFLPTVL